MVRSEAAAHHRRGLEVEVEVVLEALVRIRYRHVVGLGVRGVRIVVAPILTGPCRLRLAGVVVRSGGPVRGRARRPGPPLRTTTPARRRRQGPSEEHTSELPSPGQPL